SLLQEIIQIRKAHAPGSDDSDDNAIVCARDLGWATAGFRQAATGFRHPTGGGSASGRSQVVCGCADLSGRPARLQSDACGNSSGDAGLDKASPVHLAPSLIAILAHQISPLLTKLYPHSKLDSNQRFEWRISTVAMQV